MEAIYCVHALDDPEGSPEGSSAAAGLPPRTLTLPPRKSCFVNAGGALFAIPLFDQFGAESDVYVSNATQAFKSPQPCRCNITSGGPASASLGNSNCDSMDFLSSFIFFAGDMLDAIKLNQNGSSVVFPAMSAFLAAQNSSQQPYGNGTTEHAYEAAWYASPHLRVADNPYSSFQYTLSNASADTWRRVFSFCQTSFGGCSLLALRSAARYVKPMIILACQ